MVGDRVMPVLREWEQTESSWRVLGGIADDIPVAPEWTYPDLVAGTMGSIPDFDGTITGVKNVGTGVIRPAPTGGAGTISGDHTSGASLTGYTINGNVTLRSNQSLIDCIINGHVTAESNCNNALLENDKVLGTSSSGTRGSLVGTDSAFASQSAVTVRFCDLDAKASNTLYGQAIGPRRFTAERNWVRGVVDGVGVFHNPASGSNVYVLVRGNFFDRTKYVRPDPFGVQSDGTHGDTGGQFQGGDGLEYYGNMVIGYNLDDVGTPTTAPTYINPTSWSNAGLMFSDNVGPIRNSKFYGNYLSGGACTANLGPLDSNDTGNIFKMNLFLNDHWPTFAYSIDRAAGNPSGTDFGTGAWRNFYADPETWQSTGVVVTMRT